MKLLMGGEKVKYLDVAKATFYDLRLKIPHKIVSMQEAVENYKQGKRVGIIQEINKDSVKVLLMDSQNTFVCNYEYLVSSQWVVLL